MPWLCLTQWLVVTTVLVFLFRKHSIYIKGTVRCSLLAMDVCFAALVTIEFLATFTRNKHLIVIAATAREIQVFKGLFYYNIFNLKTVSLFLKANADNHDQLIKQIRCNKCIYGLFACFYAIL